jgi:hypothetical protein
VKHALVPFVCLVLMTPGFSAAAEPLVGTWRLDHQEINGAQTDSDPLTLKVSQSGDKLTFAFSIPVNNVYFVSMSYTLKLDGSEAEVTNAQGEKMGTVQMTRDAALRYKLILKGQNRPDSSGRITVSADGKILTSEADTMKAGRALHSTQVFKRY